MTAFVAAGRRCIADVPTLWHRCTFGRQQSARFHSGDCEGLPSDRHHDPMSSPNPMPEAVHALMLPRTAAGLHDGAPA